MINRSKRFITFLLVILLCLSEIMTAPISTASELPETIFGKVIDFRTMTVAPQVTYEKYDMIFEQGSEKVNFIEFDLSNPNLKLQIGKSAGYVYGLQTPSNTVNTVDKEGNRVIAAMNGDFFNPKNGIPVGIVIDDGRILVTPAKKWFTLGVKSDKSVIYSENPVLKKMLLVSGKVINITDINRLSPLTEAVVFYTSDFYDSTKTSEIADEYVCEIVEGDVKSGEIMRLKVVDIKKNTGNTAIKENQVVLSITGKYKRDFEEVEKGDEIKAYFELEEQWQDVNMAIGGQALILKDGQIPKDLNQAKHPRSAIGTKEDGTMVMMVVDGRESGVSEGVSLEDLAKIMKDLGCVNAINLDGGGSSTIMARVPGDSKTTVLNTPSDGKERKVANSILLVDQSEQGPASQFVVRPNMERILVGNSIQLDYVAIDENYHPAKYDGDVSWEVDSDMGSITKEGLFTASNKAGLAEITVTSGKLKGKGEIEVVKDITDLKLDLSSLSIACNTTKTLNVTALRNGQVIQSKNEDFSWRVEGPIGTINDQGFFISTEKADKRGKIIVSYEVPGITTKIESSINVKVGRPPVIIEDFENGVTDWEVTGARYIDIGLDVETYEDYVRFGKKSAKVTYDFSGKKGTSGVYLSPKHKDITLSGYPESIGMWVYGDGNEHWLRSGLRDGNNTPIYINYVSSTTGVDFTGWRYMQADIPKGLKLPLKLELPVRYMEVNDAKKDSGAIYIDQIRAIYGELDEDLEPPIIKNISPREGETVKTNTPEILVFGEDFGYNKEDSPKSTLIDGSKTRVYIDDQLVEHSFNKENGKISYQMEEPLTDGLHKVTVKIRDGFGNPTIKKWSFFVETGAPRVTINKGQDKIYAGDTFTVNLSAIQPLKIKNAQLNFGFNNKQVEVQEVTKGSKLSDENILTEINNETGQVKVTFLDIDGLTNITESDDLGKIIFRVKSDAEGKTLINLESGLMNFADKVDKVYNFYALPKKYKIDYHLNIEWNPEGAIEGQPTTFLVTDEAGAPIEDAKLVNVKTDETIGTTNSEGVLTIDTLTESLRDYRIQASKGNLYSSIETFKVYKGIETIKPNQLNISMGANPANSMALTWQTSPVAEGSVVEYVKKSDFTSFDDHNVKRVEGKKTLNITDKGALLVHKAVINHLEPGVEYVYRVGDGQQTYSEMGEFKTALPYDNSFEFVHIADSQAATQSDYNTWGNLLNNALSDFPNTEFVVHTGDMVDDGSDAKQWQMWFDAAKDILGNIPLVTAIGNHEANSQNGINNYLTRFNNPLNGIAELKGSSYSFDYKNAHFVVLNSESNFAEQAKWLEKDLKSTNKLWKIVALHRGPYGSIYDSEHIREHWTHVFDEYDVDLVLSGHDHVYMRSYPMVDGKVSQDGTIYVIGGSSGPKYYDVTERYWQEMTYDDDVPIFSNIKIDDDQLTFIAKNEKGELVDQFLIKKSIESFEDVASDYWAEDAIHDLVKRGVVNGKGDGSKFAPLDSITRAETVTMLVRLFGFTKKDENTTFNDMTGNEWYADYVKIASSNSIVSGYPDGSFEGNKQISRQELSTMVNNAIKVANKTLPYLREQANFSDDASIAGFAKEPVNRLYQGEVINGYPDGSLQPLRDASRAEMVNIMYNLIKKLS